MASKDRSSSEDVSILSSGVRIEGNIFSQGNIRIDGNVIGNVNANGNLTLGDKAMIAGDIKAQNIILSGSVEGLVVATEKLVLEATSKIIGEITAKVLVVEAGAKFEGKSHMIELDLTQKSIGSVEKKETLKISIEK